MLILPNELEVRQAPAGSRPLTPPTLERERLIRYNLYVTLRVLVNGGLRVYPAGHKTSTHDPLSGLKSRGAERPTHPQMLTEPRPKEIK